MFKINRKKNSNNEKDYAINVATDDKKEKEKERVRDIIYKM